MHPTDCFSDALASRITDAVSARIHVIFPFIMATEYKPSAARAPDDEDMMHLLHDLAPELSLRWVSRLTSLSKPPALSPQFFRGLIAIALRAAVPGDSASAINVLELALSLPQENPFSTLGFSSAMSLLQIHDVFEDLLSASIHQIPLRSNGPALSYYCTAGVGTADEADYESEEGHTEQHVNFRMHRAPLALVRTENVVSVVHYFGDALHRISKDIGVAKFAEDCQRVDAGNENLGLARCTMMLDTDGLCSGNFLLRQLPKGQLWKLYLKTFPERVASLSSDALLAVQLFFRPLINCESGEQHTVIVNEFTTVVSNLSAQESSRALGLFIRSIPCTSLRLEVSRKCLEILFKARKGRGNSAKRSSKSIHVADFINRYVHPLLKEKMSARECTGIPALLTAFGESWLACAGENDFVLEHDQFKPMTERLQRAFVRLRQQKRTTVTRDVAATGVMLFAVSTRSLHASRNYWNRKSEHRCSGRCDFH